jgi:hypothetical protein
MKRTLTLRREVLAELATEDLRQVVAGATDVDTLTQRLRTTDIFSGKDTCPSCRETCTARSTAVGMGYIR